LGGEGVDHGFSLEGVPVTDEGVSGQDGVGDNDVAAGGVDPWLAEEHGEGDGFALHPGVGLGEHFVDEAAAPEMMGNADLGDAADAELVAANEDEFVVGGGVGDQFAGGRTDEPSVGWDFANVTAGEKGGLVGEAGEEKAAESRR
jgi:hypothetical protein